MFRRSEPTHSMHMYVTQTGLLRLLIDVTNLSSSEKVVVRGSGANNTMFSVWITPAAYNSLSVGDFTARYR